MKKALFLDIDGVFNIASGSNLTYIKKGVHLEDEIIALFDKMLLDKDFDIIISSSWRSDMEDLKEILCSHNFKSIDKIKGFTELDSQGSGFRNIQIINFLQNNKYDKYAVLDDDFSLFFNQDKLSFHQNINIDNLVLTDSKIGLTRDDLLEVSKLLDIN